MIECMALAFMQVSGGGRGYSQGSMHVTNNDDISISTTRTTTTVVAARSALYCIGPSTTINNVIIDDNISITCVLSSRFANIEHCS